MRRFICALVVLVMAAACARAEDAFYAVALKDLKITAGRLPEYPGQTAWWLGGLPPAAHPRAVLNDAGEAFCELRDDGAGILVARAPAGRDLAGRLFLPRADGQGMELLSFVVPASLAAERARSEFWRVRRDHYAMLMARDLPGAAWFRHQVALCERALGKEAARPDRAQAGFAPRTVQVEEMFDLFTGNRAVAENLQLDRMLGVRGGAGGTVSLDKIKGIDTRELDFQRLLPDGAAPALDPLAALIPFDQHAVFFAGFDAAGAMLDEAARSIVPVLQAAESHGHDFALQQRYQRQLCLNFSALARALAPNIVRTVAVTGSDPFLRMGSDVAVLMEAKDAEVLRGVLVARLNAAAGSSPHARSVTGECGGVGYTGLVSADRSTSALVMVLGSAVVVSNSEMQLRRLVDVHRGDLRSMASLAEYRFFRHRYRPGDAGETAFLVLPDAAIRRWCSPRWRIADSRRIRAAAVMTSLLAEHMPALVAGGQPVVVEHPDFGRITLSADGARSEIYGTPGMMTPIIELPIDAATAEEAEAYGRWRDGYQNNWPTFFDPVAARFCLRGDTLALDATIMPLIGGSDYRQVMEAAGSAKLAPDAGDPHDALVHAILAVDPDSPPLKQVGGIFAQWGLNINLLSWLGGAVSLYVDDDPYWKNLAAVPEAQRLSEKMLVGLPVAVRAEVKSPMHLTLFLVALRGMIEGAAPGLVTWEPRQHAGQTYVKVGPSPQARAQHKEIPEDLSLYYVSMPEALVVSLNENVIRSAIDRQQQRNAAATRPAATRPSGRAWPGSGMCLRVRRQFMENVWPVLPPEGRAVMAWRSWANIPILNEWKRLAPQRDPVELHERLWHMKLQCPGGGRYVWNEQWQTMESTVYGHPGQPKKVDDMPAVLRDVESGEFGLDFERDGVRAKVLLERSSAR